MDLISYQVVSIMPFTLKEVVKGDGDCCGAVFLDDAFRKQVVARVGGEENFKNIEPKYRREMMKSWEDAKRGFEGGDGEDWDISLKGIERPEDRIQDGELKLSA